MKRRATTIRSVYAGMPPDRRERRLDALAIVLGLLLLSLLTLTLVVL